MLVQLCGGQLPHAEREDYRGEFMLDTSPVKFLPFDWSFKLPDPNDHVLGQLVTTNSSEVTRSDVILYGIPFDKAVLGRKGAALGPCAIRTAARTLKTFALPQGSLRCRIVDLGDVVLSGKDVAAAHIEAEKAARYASVTVPAARGTMGVAIRRDVGAPSRVIALGGDHSLTFPCAWPYLEHFREKLAVINLDAHLDVRCVREGEPFNSGSSFGRLLDGGLTSYTVIGARRFQTSTAYEKRVQDCGGRIVTADEVYAKSAVRIARDVLKKLPRNCRAIYLSVDLDVADASVAPGVSAPTPGGLLAHQLFELVRMITSDARVIACDIMELAPPLEEPNSDRTARLAAGCLAEMVATASLAR